MRSLHTPTPKRAADRRDLATQTRHEVVADGQVAEQAGRPIGRHQARAGASLGESVPTGDFDAASRAFEASDRSHELPRPGPLDPDERHDLAGLHLELDAGELVAAVRPCIESQCRRGIGSQVGSIALVRLPMGLAGHEAVSDPLLGERVALEHVGADAIDDQRDPIGVPGQLRDAMGDEQTTLPPRASKCMRPKRSLDSSWVSAELGSSNRKIRASRARARPISTRCWVASGTRRTRTSATSRMARSAMSCRSRVPQVADQRPRALATDHQVFGDGQVGEELWLLVHDRHSIGLGTAVPRLAIELDVASVRVGLASQDLDERALARAVRSGDPEDLAAARIEVKPIQGPGVAVPLAQPADPKTGRVRGGHHAGSGARHRIPGIVGHAARPVAHFRRLCVKRSRTTAAMVTAPDTKLLR